MVVVVVMAVVLRYNSGIDSGSIGGTGSSSGSGGGTWLRRGYCHIWDIQYYCEGYFFFLYFNEFLFCYVLHFFYTLTYEHVGKIQKKKRKGKLNIYTSQTCKNYILTKKK